MIEGERGGGKGTEEENMTWSVMGKDRAGEQERYAMTEGAIIDEQETTEFHN